MSRRIVLLLCLALSFSMLAACSEDSASHGSDLPDAVSIEIDEKGGTLVAKGVTLVIPEGALDKKTMISAKKLDEAMVAESTKDVQAVQVSPVYEFGPKGLAFKKEIDVKFDTEKPEPAAKVYFTKQGSDDKEFEQLATVVDQKAVSAKVKHFSLGFAGVPLDGPGLDGGVGGGPDASLGDSGAGVLDGAAGDGGLDTGPRTVVVTSKDPWGVLANQTWAAFQDGDGAWTRLAPAGVGTYSFVVSSGRYGFAYVCGNGSNSDGQLLFAPSTHDALNIQLNGLCATNPPGAILSGNITAPDSGDVDYAHRFTSGSIPVLSFMPTNYNIGALYTGFDTDIVLGLRVGGAITKFDTLRSYVPSTFDSRDIDLTTTGMAPELHNVTLQGNASAYLDVSLRPKGVGAGLSVIGTTSSDGAGGLTAQYAKLPTGLARTDDHYDAFAALTEGSDYREVSLSVVDPDALVIQLPAVFAPTDLSQGGSGYFGPTMSFDDVPNATAYSMCIFFNTGTFTMTTEVGWFGDAASSHRILFPDLTGVDMFDPAWVPASDATPVDVTGGVISVSGPAQSSTRTYATHNSTFTIAP
ncbi:MAG: hypothetical protein QM778_18870 [Myxococcales bacterium]